MSTSDAIEGSHGSESACVPPTGSLNPQMCFWEGTGSSQLDVCIQPR